jgi:6-pyruvoyltetrahydropterin/6-carboxytetrahydropterin synthase
MPIATIAKEFTFDAAHSLPNHAGKCRRMHGHTYRVTVIARGLIQPIDGGPEEGMTLDFDRIREIYKRRIEPLCDHQYLNETVPVERTTAELLAAWMLGEMRVDLPQVVAVRVSETRSSWAEVTVGDLDASEA